MKCYNCDCRGATGFFSLNVKSVAQKGGWLNGLE